MDLILDYIRNLTPSLQDQIISRLYSLVLMGKSEEGPVEALQGPTTYYNNLP